MAIFARVQTRDLQFLHRSANRIPKVNLNLVLQIAAGFFLRLHGDAVAPAAKELAEKIAERGASGLPSEIETPKIKIDVLPASLRAWPVIPRRDIVAIEAVLVVHLALLRVGEDVVGFLQLFELFFRGFVARIEVRMILAGQLSKSGADIFRAGLAWHA